MTDFEAQQFGFAAKRRHEPLHTHYMCNGKSVLANCFCDRENAAAQSRLCQPMLRHALAGVSTCGTAMRIMLSRSLPHPSSPEVTASCRRPAVPSMHGMCCCDLPWRQHGMQAVTANTSWVLPAVRPMSTSARKLVVQAATGKPVSAAVAARAAVDPNSLRVVDTELHVEAERSYLAVRTQHHHILKHSAPQLCAGTLL